MIITGVKRNQGVLGFRRTKKEFWVQTNREAYFVKREGHKFWVLSFGLQKFWVLGFELKNHKEIVLGFGSFEFWV